MAGLRWARTDAEPRPPRASARLRRHRGTAGCRPLDGRPARHRHPRPPLHDMGVPARRLPALEQLLVRRPLRLRRLQPRLLPRRLGGRRGRDGGRLGRRAGRLRRRRRAARVGPGGERTLPRPGGDGHRHMLRLGDVPVPGRSRGGSGRARLRPAPSADRIRGSDGGLARLLAARVRPCGRRARRIRPGQPQPPRASPAATSSPSPRSRSSRPPAIAVQRAFPAGGWYPYHAERPARDRGVLRRRPLPDRQEPARPGLAGWCSSPTSS